MAEALLGRNVESLQRCVLLRPPGRAPAAVRLLFVGEIDGDVPGCLLDHMPT